MPADVERGRRARWAVLAVSAMVVVAAAVVLQVAPRSEPAPRSPKPASPSPGTPTYYLVVDLRRVDEVAVTGRVRKHEVKDVAEAARQTLAGVYGAGFVNTAQWEGGRFPALFQHFAGSARDRAHRDLSDLTLGRSATRLSVVRPERARVNVRVLVDVGGRPVSAIASMEFKATGLRSDGSELPIRHDGRYVLRPIDGRWLIVAYDVRGRLGASA